MTIAIAARPTTPQAALLAAADLIEEVGWCQGSAEDNAGRLCLFGAIMKVTDTYRSSAKPEDLLIERQAYSLACEAVAKLPRPGNRSTYHGAIAFNEYPGRTAQEVVALLRAAAAL
jgi:hypothetical protein